MFWDQYMPHIQAAAGKCDIFGKQVLNRLDRIIDNQDDSLYGDVDAQLVKRIAFNQVVTGTYDFSEAVPLSEAWVIDFVCCGGAWLLKTNGGNNILLSSANAVIMNPCIVLPGERLQLTIVGPNDFSMQVTRRVLTADPKRARSRSEDIEQLGPQLTPVHEVPRDMANIGPYPQSRSAVEIRES